MFGIGIKFSLVLLDPPSVASAVQDDRHRSDHSDHDHQKGHAPAHTHRSGNGHQSYDANPGHYGKEDNGNHYSGSLMCGVCRHHCNFWIARSTA